MGIQLIFIGYLRVRWGLDLSNLVVFAGECCDTDYKSLLGGFDKTVILKGVGIRARKLHGNRNYPLEDIKPFDSLNIVQTEACGLQQHNCIIAETWGYEGVEVYSSQFEHPATVGESIIFLMFGWSYNKVWLPTRRPVVSYSCCNTFYL